MLKHGEDGFESENSQNNKLTFGDLFPQNKITEDNFQIYIDQEIDSSSVKLFLRVEESLENRSDIYSDVCDYEISSVLKFQVCLRIVQSDKVFESCIYDAIFDECESRCEVIAYLAQNQNISLELGKRIIAKTLKIKNRSVSSQLQFMIASNPSDEFPLRFLKSIAVLVENRDTLRLFSPVSEYVNKTKLAVEGNIIERVHKLALELEKSSQIFGGQVNTSISKLDFIDLTLSIRECNDLGEFLQSIPIERNFDPGGIVKYEEVKPENIYDLLNSNNPESLIGVVARIKDFFAEFEEKWGSV